MKRMSEARINRIAKKYSASASAKANFATTNPELQMTINIQGAVEMSLFTKKGVKRSLVARDMNRLLVLSHHSDDADNESAECNESEPPTDD